MLRLARPLSLALGSVYALPACAPTDPPIVENSDDDDGGDGDATSPGSTSGPPSTTGDEETGTTGEPPAETALLVHSFGVREMGPFEEVEPCVQWTLANDQPIYVNTVTLANDGGFHHSNWLVVPEDAFAGEDGFFKCSDRGFSELQAAVAGTVLFAQSTQSRYEEQALPAGVVIKIPPRHKLIAGTHLLNLSSAELASELRMSLELIHPRDVEIIVAPFRLNYGDLIIPPKTESRHTGDCLLADQYEAKADVPLDLKLYHVLPHYHYLGNYFSVEILGGARDGEEIFHHEGFNADGNGRTYNPPIDLTGAEGLRFTCGYDNWHDKEINYGIGDQEMCVMLGLADMRVMMNASVDSGSELVGNEDGRAMFKGPCATIALPKNAAQGMPSQAEQAGPLYVPPQTGGDVDLDPVKPCVDASGDAEPAVEPTLTNLRSTLFNPSCTFSSCHGGKTPVHLGLDRADLHAVLLGEPVLADTTMPLVDPGDPDNSWLYQLLSRCDPQDDSDVVHIHMPFNAPTLLDERTIATFRAWIEAGAQDD